jgi:hypothetical protein
VAYLSLQVTTDVRAEFVHCFEQFASHECVVDAFFAAHRFVESLTGGLQGVERWYVR